MYGPSQLRIIGMELARSGWCVGPALHALHSNYESFRSLSESTLRKLLKDPHFDPLIAAQMETVAQARKVTDLEIAQAGERAEALNPLRKMVLGAASETHDLARKNPDANTYRVLLGFAKLLRSMEPDRRGSLGPGSNLGKRKDSAARDTAGQEGPSCD